MADPAFFDRIVAQLDGLAAAGLLKPERVLSTPQGAEIAIGGQPAINLCANNYLGLANEARTKQAAAEALERWGQGLASVRFICGTQGIHKQLERATADYIGTDDAILFAAAFDANGGVFEPLLNSEDAIVSDSLNHASIIDGIRLCGAKRFRFANGDMDDLDRQLAAARAAGARHILIVTDGVFSMDGHIARLATIVDLADRYGALTMVDDCHATGVIGPRGRGSAAHCGVEGRIDIITGTYGKALGGAMGGFVAARQPIVDLLRQKARPYLFSNALSPMICAAALAAIRISDSDEGDALRARLGRNALRLRRGLADSGIEVLPGEHPIIPVMLGDALLAQKMAARLFDEGVHVTAFSFPVVPRDCARLRLQASAVLADHHIDHAVTAIVQTTHVFGLQASLPD